MILASFLVAALVLAMPAMAQDSSPYVIGHWKFADSFQDFTPGTPLVTTIRISAFSILLT